jgi:hypothetical protein
MILSVLRSPSFSLPSRFSFILFALRTCSVHIFDFVTILLLCSMCGDVSVAYRGQEKCLSCVPSCLKDVCQLCPELSEGRVSVVSRVVWRKCVSCVPSCLKEVCQLCPELSEGRVSVVSRVVWRNCVSCVQRLGRKCTIIEVQKSRIQSNTTFRYNCTIETQGTAPVACQGVCFMCICCVPSRQQHAYELQRIIWLYKMSSNLNVLTQFYCTLQWHAHIQNYWMISTMHSCYIMLLSNV